jgi:hypothetical protein
MMGLMDHFSHFGTMSWELIKHFMLIDKNTLKIKNWINSKNKSEKKDSKAKGK